MSTAIEPARPLIYGYIRALPELAPEAVALLADELADFARSEGFTFAGVYVERRWLHSMAWDALVTACYRHGVRNVVVPDSMHLHTLPALSFVMQSVIEEAIGGHVWFVHPDASEELPCPSWPRSTAPVNVPRQPNQLLTVSLRLAAVSSAVPCSRMFVRAVFQRWRLADYIETAELVISELESACPLRRTVRVSESTGLCNFPSPGRNWLLRRPVRTA